MLSLLPGGLVGFDSVLDWVLLESGLVNVREVDVVSIVDSVREKERDELVVAVLSVMSGLVREVVVCVVDDWVGRTLLSTVAQTWVSKHAWRDTHVSCIIHHKSYTCHTGYWDTFACQPAQSEDQDSWSFSRVRNILRRLRLGFGRCSSRRHSSHRRTCSGNPRDSSKRWQVSQTNKKTYPLADRIATRSH